MAKHPTSTSRPRAVGYVRVSTGKQADHGGSLAVQRDRIVEHAVLAGLEIGRIYEDAACGAKDEDARPGFAAALEAIRAGDAQVLIVTDVDRLARDSDVAGHARVEVRRARGRVVVISEVAQNVETIAVRQLLATLEREKIRARMRVWAGARRAAGKHLGNTPYGAKMTQDGLLEPVGAEVGVIQRMVTARRQGASLRAIVRTLEAGNVPNRSGTPWNPTTVSAILSRAGA
ncbi:MAG: recombinase family protein [Planctomycetota bacterium]